MSNRTVIINSQIIPACDNGMTLFSDTEIAVITEARQRLSTPLVGTIDAMMDELHHARMVELEGGL
jgi:hypothetical protein